MVEASQTKEATLAEVVEAGSPSDQDSPSDLATPAIDEVSAVCADQFPEVLPCRERVGRPRCQHCNRPQRICICDALPPGGPLDTRTRIVILVHPKEVQRRLGTMPLLRLCLRNLIVREGDHFPEPEDDPEFHTALQEGGHRCMLVCPGPDAEVLQPPEDGAAEEKSDQPPATLIFVDGRWPQAKAMVNRSVWLQQLPRVVLCPREASGYKFRKQPGQGCLSTLEAVAEALLALEGRQHGIAVKEALTAPFRKMVQLQIPFIPDHERRDKNADLAPEARASASSARPFDAEAVLEEFLPEESKEASTLTSGGCRDGKIHVMVRWGDKSVEGCREVVVVEVISGELELAKRRAAEESFGRPRGRRCWLLPVSKVPPGARFETPEEKLASASGQSGRAGAACKKLAGRTGCAAEVREAGAVIADSPLQPAA